MTTCDKCGDDGSIRNRVEPSGRVLDLGGGFTMRDEGGYSTSLCECRKNLPRRYGRAHWWTTEIVFSEEWSSEGGLSHVEVSIEVEVPISEDNYPLHRTAENRYWGVTPRIDVDFSCDMTAGDLRSLCVFLGRMADKADELDAPYPDEEAQP